MHFDSALTHEYCIVFDKVIRDRVFGTYSRCCESVVYDWRRSVCCAGVLHCKLTDSAAVSCCGNHLYNPRSQICCSDCPGIVYIQPALTTRDVSTTLPPPRAED